MAECRGFLQKFPTNGAAKTSELISYFAYTHTVCGKRTMEANSCELLWMGAFEWEESIMRRVQTRTDSSACLFRKPSLFLLFCNRQGQVQVRSQLCGFSYFVCARMVFYSHRWPKLFHSTCFEWGACWAHVNNNAQFVLNSFSTHLLLPLWFADLYCNMRSCDEGIRNGYFPWKHLALLVQV